MNVEGTVPARATRMSRQEIKVQMAEYLAQQPAAKQAFHKWMKVLEVAGLALLVGVFAVALYVSIRHTAFLGTTIAAAWFAFPVSAVPLMILEGLHTIVLRASLPWTVNGRPRAFVTGSRAVWSGWVLIAMALAAGAFWGILAYAVWTFDTEMIGGYGRIVGTALGVVIPAAIILGLVSALYRQFVRSR